MHTKEVTLTRNEWRDLIKRQNIRNRQLRGFLLDGFSTLTIDGVRYTRGAQHHERLVTREANIKPVRETKPKPAKQTMSKTPAKPAVKPKAAPVVPFSASRRVADAARAAADRAALEDDNDFPPPQAA